jgi:hypothetical protein
VVDVVSKADYKKWVSEQQAAAAAAIASANQITNTVFIKKGISLQIRMIRGDEWIAFPMDYRRSTKRSAVDYQ